MVSDYRFRGLSQTMRDPAVQASISAARGGFTGSIWASNVEGFADAEIDFVLDYGFSHGDNNFNVGGIYYAYAGSGTDGLDYVEGYATWGRSFGDWSLGLAGYYSPDFFGGSGNATYSQASASFAATEKVSINSYYGYQYVEESGVYGVPDYSVWSIGVSYTPDIVTFALDYVDTDISDTECGGNSCDGSLIASVSVSF
ncbi:hypothetical protein GCM10007148_09610 [Parvularcula lutaonensis]|nr:hypothetical protein GCM10007148_09610 [Parvularcula lutaonensis]